jgi:Protein of unknown function (DUF3570)
VWIVFATALVPCLAAASEPKPARPADPARPTDKASASPSNADAAQALLAQALVDNEQGRYEQCVDRDRESVKLDDQVTTRLHLSLCLFRVGKLKAAVEEAIAAARLADERKEAAATEQALKQVAQLSKRWPKVRFVLPKETYQNFRLRLDGQDVPKDKWTEARLDPGGHIVTATGTKGGKNYAFRDAKVVARESQLVTVVVDMQLERALSDTQISCLEQAPNELEAKKCLPSEERSTIIKASTDFSGYVDTAGVRVFSPAIAGSVSSPTAGWNVGGSYLVDVVSAASPDIVSYASPPFREVRHAGSLYGGYKPGPWGVQASANLSVEPDYWSRTVGMSGTYDLNDKATTPRLAISYTWDKIGRKPFSDCLELKSQYQGDASEAEGVCYRPFSTWTVDAGVTQIVSKNSLFQLGATAQFERGDQSKPYRYVPMFTAANAAKIVPGSSVSSVNRTRESARPREQLPTERDRYALAGRFLQRIGETMTLRAEERLYLDTWGTFGSTTDVRYLIDVGTRLRVWPHVRFHVQTAAAFYQLAYTVKPADRTTGALALPLYRSGDRELSTMFGATFGAGGHLGLGNLDAETKAGLTLAVDAMLNHYTQSLFLTDRTALYTSLAFDLEF